MPRQPRRHVLSLKNPRSKRSFFPFLKKINKKEREEGSLFAFGRRRRLSRIDCEISCRRAERHRRPELLQRVNTGTAKANRITAEQVKALVSIFVVVVSCVFAFVGWSRTLRTLRFPLSRVELRCRSRWSLVTGSHSHSTLAANAAPRTGDLHIAKPRPRPLPACF